MQIVIDIPDEMYQKIKEMNMIISGKRSGKRLDCFLFNAVNTGTPLPKGHGNLIERNKVFNALHCFYAHDALDIVCNLPVIIEADKEEEE